MDSIQPFQYKLLSDRVLLCAKSFILGGEVINAKPSLQTRLLDASSNIIPLTLPTLLSTPVSMQDYIKPSITLCNLERIVHEAFLYSLRSIIVESARRPGEVGLEVGFDSEKERR